MRNVQARFDKLVSRRGAFARLGVDARRNDNGRPPESWWRLYPRLTGWLVSGLLLLMALDPVQNAMAGEDVPALVAIEQSDSGEQSKPLANKAKKQRAPRIVQNNGGVVFSPLSDSEQDLTAPKLGNGEVADTGLWRASVLAKVGNEICTATLVGPEALLTAKHCVANGAIARIEYKDGGAYEGPCTHPKGSIGDLSADWALCRMKPPVSRPGLAYEFVSVDPAKVKEGLRLTAGGYGCTDIETKEKEKDPKFRIGSVFVDQLPSPGQQWPNWILTDSAKDGGSAFICPGDSGGAAYLVEPSGHRAVVAVATGVGDDPTLDDFLVSYLAALSTPAGQRFLSDWLDANPGARICGLRVGPDNCHPNPP